MLLLPTAEMSADECGRAEGEYADYLSAMIKAQGLTYREIETVTEKKLTKSRLSRIFPENKALRSPIKLQEVHLLLQVLEIERWQAAVSIDLLRFYPDAELDLYTSVALLVASTLRGLPEQLFEMLSLMDGLDASDIYPTHGRHIQKLVLESIEAGYREMAQRKEKRAEMNELLND